jgi:hypothetical protein
MSSNATSRNMASCRVTPIKMFLKRSAITSEVGGSYWINGDDVPQRKKAIAYSHKLSNVWYRTPHEETSRCEVLLFLLVFSPSFPVLLEEHPELGQGGASQYLLDIIKSASFSFFTL